MKKIVSAVLSVIMLIGCSQAWIFSAETTAAITNGDFESSITEDSDWKFSNYGGWYYGGGASVTTSEHHGGSSSLKVSNASVVQRIDLSAGVSYTLSAYVKADSATSSPAIGFYDGTASYPAASDAAVSVKTVSASSSWQEVTVTLDCTASQAYAICITSWDGAVVYFDDVTLVSHETEYDGNGITNGDFSDGTAGWTFSNTTNMAVSNGALTASGTNYEAKISQRVSGLENGVYNLSAYTTSTDISGICYLYAKTTGHTMASTSIPIGTVQQKIVVPGIVVENGRCDIGLYINGSSTVTLDNLSFSKADDTRVPFLKGGEISKLTYVEDKGGKFYYSDGTAGDALQIMAENGFNLARIRVLNNPGKGRGNGTYYLPEGYQDLNDCLKLARRAKDKGMQIEFTFAYSDWWTDSGEQFPPNEWLAGASGLSGSALADYYAGKIYDYTKEVLQKLNAQGTTPEFVSIGNEMQLGMCFGAYQSNNGLYNSSTYIAQLANAGAKAVREVCPDSKIILHSDNGGLLISKRASFINSLKNIDFDVIGVSYYPYYNEGTVSIDAVVSEFKSLINTYDKDVIIMETGYNWTELRGDGYEGQLQDNGYYQNIYGETEKGQRAFLTELYAKLKQVLGTRCIGDLYWDPIMLYDGASYKIGWAVSEDGNWTQGNVISNSTIFNLTGKALNGQLAMKYNTNSEDKILITGTVKKSGGSTRPGSGTSTTAAANTEITFTVNDGQYTVTADAYGQYIVAVDYPSGEMLGITADGYDGSYYIDAPQDGVLVSDIDFPTTRNDEIPEPTPTPVPTSTPTPTPIPTSTPTPVPTSTPTPTSTAYSVEYIDGAAVVTAADSGTYVVIFASYDGDDKLINVELKSVSFMEAGNKTVPTETFTTNGAVKVKVMLWNSLNATNGMRPLCAAGESRL